MGTIRSFLRRGPSNGTDSGVGESVLITQPPLGGWSPSYSKGVLGGTRAVGFRKERTGFDTLFFHHGSRKSL